MKHKTDSRRSPRSSPRGESNYSYDAAPAPAIVLDSVKNLAHVELSCLDLPPTVGQALMQGLTSARCPVVHLNFSGNLGTPSLAEAIAARVNAGELSTLRELNVAGTQLGDSGVAVLVDALLRNKTQTLSFLDVSWNGVQSVVGGRAIAQAILMCTALKSIDYRYNHIDYDRSGKFQRVILEALCLRQRSGHKIPQLHINGSSALRWCWFGSSADAGLRNYDDDDDSDDEDNDTDDNDADDDRISGNGEREDEEDEEEADDDGDDANYDDIYGDGDDGVGEGYGHAYCREYLSSLGDGVAVANELLREEFLHVFVECVRECTAKRIGFLRFLVNVCNVDVEIVLDRVADAILVAAPLPLLQFCLNYSIMFERFVAAAKQHSSGGSMTARRKRRAVIPRFGEDAFTVAIRESDHAYIKQALISDGFVVTAHHFREAIRLADARCVQLFFRYGHADIPAEFQARGYDVNYIQTI